jgi:hypothetical protein
MAICSLASVAAEARVAGLPVDEFDGGSSMMDAAEELGFSEDGCAVLRNYPISAHLRFLLEEMRPEMAGLDQVVGAEDRE